MKAILKHWNAYVQEHPLCPAWNDLQWILFEDTIDNSGSLSAMWDIRSGLQEDLGVAVEDVKLWLTRATTHLEQAYPGLVTDVVWDGSCGVQGVIVTLEWT